MSWPFVGEKCVVRRQKISANLAPLQLFLDAAATVCSHLIAKFRFSHQLGNGFREFGFLVRPDINGSLSGRKACFFQIEGDNRLPIRHVFHYFDPSRNIAINEN
jgi:hypothetical protein